MQQHHDFFWYPFSFLGITADWSAVDLDLISRALVVSTIILGLCLYLRFVYRKANATEWSSYTVSLFGLEQINGMVTQSLPHAKEYQTAFIAHLFLFILLCNWLLILGLEEPTADYNMTLALALGVFLWVQKQAISAHGITGYAQEFIKMPFSIFPLTPLRLLLLPFLIVGNILVFTISFPLEIVGKLSQIMSLSFRLFGNIMAGSIIWSMCKSLSTKWLWGALIGLLGLNIVVLGFFGIFEGMIQAFVFTMLTTTYLGIGASKNHND